MFDGLLKDQVRGDPDIAGMLTTFKGKPAFFYQRSPRDDDAGWDKPCFPRADYSVDMRHDPARKTRGVMTINVWCTPESAVMPADIERRLIGLISGTFYGGPSRAAVCAVWNRSKALHYEPVNTGGNIVPELFGVTLLFDLLQFPEQISTDPDPIQALNRWTGANFPAMTVIPRDDTPEIWKPTDESPAIYWRFEGAAASDRQGYAVNWYTGQFAAHIITGSVTECNRWQKAIAERIQWEGEVLLSDGSPMFAKQIAIRPDADPLREGQLLVTGYYGVPAQRRKEHAQTPLNHASYPNLRMEVNVHGN